MKVIKVSTSNSNEKQFAKASPDWTFILCRKGGGILHANGFAVTFEVGDILLQPPGQTYYISGSDFRNIELQISGIQATEKSIKISAGAGNITLCYGLFSNILEHFVSQSVDAKAIMQLEAELLFYYLKPYFTLQVFNLYVEKFKKFVLENFTNCELDLHEFIQHLPYSEDHFRRLFFKETGITPVKFLHTTRINYACSLIRTAPPHTITVKDIAMAVGFSDPYYFSRVFTKSTGVSPKSYIDQVAAP